MKKINYSHKSNTTEEAENSIELSTKIKKKGQLLDKLISGSGVAEAKGTINCSPLRYNFFPLHLLVFLQKARR